LVTLYYAMTRIRTRHGSRCTSGVRLRLLCTRGLCHEQQAGSPRHGRAAPSNDPHPLREPRPPATRETSPQDIHRQPAGRSLKTKSHRLAETQRHKPQASRESSRLGVHHHPAGSSQKAGMIMSRPSNRPICSAVAEIGLWDWLTAWLIKEKPAKKCASWRGEAGLLPIWYHTLARIRTLDGSHSTLGSNCGFCS